MNEALRLSPVGAKLVKHFESCLKPIGGGRFKPYRCPAGVLTIGWGHTNHHGRQFNASSVWTQAECDEAFLEDMKGFEAAVKRLVKVKLNPYQFDALVSFTYNCGEGNFSKSNILRSVNRGDFEAAARGFAAWNKARVNGVLTALPGLTRRRAVEALLFQGIADNNFDGRGDGRLPEFTEPMAQAVEPPEPPKSIVKSKTAGAAATVGAAAATAAVEQAAEVAASVPASEDAPSGMIERGLELAMEHGEKFLTNWKLMAAVAVVGLVVFIIWDRNKKLKEEGV